MDIDFATAMRRALQQTRAGDPAAATRAIQAALGQGRAGNSGPTGATSTPATAYVDVEDAEVIEDHPRAPADLGSPRSPEGTARPTPPGGKCRRLREVVDALRRGAPGGLPRLRRHDARPGIPDGARYETRTFACSHGSRDYRLYVPAALPAGPQGLILMLHGCTQTPDDFACGTGMNAEAERHGLIVVYPHQTRTHNGQGCWNWFRPGDQRAETGEPAILAGLAREVAREFRVDGTRIFAAGLSAGGAMAAILGGAHPDVFSAIGVHSGLPQGAAHDVVSAFSAMRGEAGVHGRCTASVRTIVFHGSGDTTVHPSNADAVIAATTVRGTARSERGRSAGGRSFTRDLVVDAEGTSLTELWRIEGAGHAWSGGSHEGSYTDPSGPSASAEMARFFLGRTE